MATRRQLDEIRALSGVCPQHDLTFNYLTAVENLKLIGAVKGMSDAQLAGSEITAMLDKVGLGSDGKHHHRTDTLSGGQKRKLSLACALIGDPKFVLLDEPTAGMDPASRRTVWQTISDAKAERAVVLTTHFLDEADALGDRIAILHKGRLQAVGSTMQLKRQTAGAFRLTLTRPPPPKGAPAADILRTAAAHVPDAALLAEDAVEVALALPQQSQQSFAALFTELDATSAAMGVTSYGLAIPTLQEVFLKITAAADAREVELQEARERGEGAPTDGELAAPLTATSSAAVAPRVSAGDGAPPPLQHPNFCQQLRMGLQMNTIVFRDPLGCFCVAALPFVLTILVFLLPCVLDRSPAPSATNFSDPATLSRVAISPQPFPKPYIVPYTPPEGTLQSQLEAVVQTFAGKVAKLATAEALAEALEAPASAYAASIGAYDVGVPASYYGYPVTATTLFHNASYESAVPVALQLLDAAYLKVAAPSITLAPSASLLPYTGDNPPPLPSFVGAMVTPPALAYLFIFLGMITLQGLVKDRLIDKTTHQLMVMGLSPALRWLINLLFWCTFWYIDLFAGIVVLSAFPDYVPGAAALPAYALTVLFAVPPLFCFLALFNFVFWCRSNVEDVVGQTYCNLIQLLVFYPSLLISAIPVVRDSPLAKSIITYSLMIIPLNQLTFSLTAIYTVAQVAAYTKAFAPDSYEEPTVADFMVWQVEIPNVDGSSPGPLLCLVFSMCTAPIWFYLLWLIDVKRYYYPQKVKEWVGPAPTDEDRDVAAERSRVEGGAADSSLIRMTHLRKTFPQPRVKNKPQPRKVAVENLSLAMDGQGCFALLGPNGAGKTTTLSMLTGDLRPSAGEAFVAGYSIRTELMQIFKILHAEPGLDPRDQQFGGLIPRGASLKEHLKIFGRLKGVPESEMERHCERVIAEFGLQDHKSKWVTKLSGGTRRKLMAAIALACEPKVCFLDEPTTGVDVGTRQFLWDRIRAKGKRGCALVLTTHYMEEADALAQRVGIMVNGRLQVLGSPQHLKSTHGGGYRVEIKGPASTAKEAKALVDTLFPDNSVLEAHGGFQVFEVGSAAGKRRDELFALGPVFTALDKAKSELGIETYTLSQTTLEQVFLNISMRQQGEDGQTQNA